MALKDIFKSLLGPVERDVATGSASKAVEAKKHESELPEVFGNVLPDRRSVQTSTGKLYPPNMARTQPGEYGLRARGGKQFQDALGRLINDDHRVWSGRVTVSIIGNESSPSLEIKHGSDVLGVVTSAMLLEHPLVLKAVQEGKPFRGSTEDGSLGGLYVRIFFTL